ncbi:hypothetical protein OAU13_01015 [bacterium]|nr:hypothetical protein [bacterium]
MAFNIQEWKSATEVGFLRPSNFLVYIYPPNWAMRAGGQPDLAFLAASSTLPGVQVLTTESRLYGQGPVVKMPYDIGVTDLTLKFYVEATGMTMGYFYDWLRNVVNLSHVQNQERSGAFSNQISYKSDYVTKIDIMLFQDSPTSKGASGQDGSIMIFTMYDAFPVSISETSLDWQAGNEIMTFNVTFTYRSFEYKTLASRASSTALKGVGTPELLAPGPVDLTDYKPQSVDKTGRIAGSNPGTDAASQTSLSRMNAFASNVRENSQNIRQQSISVVKQVESTIYNNDYIKTAQNVVGAVNDVKKTLGVLSNLNNTLKNDLKQQLRTVTGGKSIKNIF